VAIPNSFLLLNLLWTTTQSYTLCERTQARNFEELVLHEETCPEKKKPTAHSAAVGFWYSDRFVFGIYSSEHARATPP
jgi:hypothetical protein